MKWNTFHLDPSTYCLLSTIFISGRQLWSLGWTVLGSRGSFLNLVLSVLKSGKSWTKWGHPKPISKRSLTQGQLIWTLLHRNMKKSKMLFFFLPLRFGMVWFSSSFPPSFSPFSLCILFSLLPSLLFHPSFLLCFLACFLASFLPFKFCKNLWYHLWN